MTDDAGTRRGLGRRRRRARRRLAIGIPLGVLVVAIGTAGVLGWQLWDRAGQVRDELQGAIPIVTQLQARATSGDLDGIAPLADELTGRAARAAAHTDDPVWRAAEHLPWVGASLTAVRAAAETVDDLVADGLAPLLDTAAGFDLAGFAPRDGAIDVAAISALAPGIADASRVVDTAAARAHAIDMTGTVPEVESAVVRLRDAIDEAAALLDGADSLVRILPGMLGAERPQTYLVLAQNPAELRPGGGITGAITELVVDDGRIEIARQASARDFPGQGFDTDAFEPTELEAELYGDTYPRFIQNATTSPDFPRAAEVAIAMWQRQYGGDVDGVISIDPIALGGLLAVTGPVTLADGTVLDGTNAAAELLNGVYLRYPDDGARQDEVLAEAARAAFAAITDLAGEPRAFIDALIKQAAAGRLLAWSADPAAQAVIESAGPLATLLPPDGPDVAGIGVYFNESTSSKIDWYLDSAIAAGAVYCEQWRRPYYEVRVDLGSLLEPGQDLPPYIVGSTAYGGHPGLIWLTTMIRLPSGSTVASLSVDGVPHGYLSTGDDGDALRLSYPVRLDPGERTEIVLRAFGPGQGAADLEVRHTPTAHPLEVTPLDGLRCPAVPLPEGQLGA